jgi:hypothetical protein
MPWKHGFDVESAAVEEEVFHFTAVFPGLGKEYVHMLSKLGTMIGTVLEVPHSMASRVAAATRVPSIKLLGSRNMKLPTHIKLPILEGSVSKKQSVLYAGLPNQCFICHKMGHLARECVGKEETRQQYDIYSKGKGIGHDQLEDNKYGEANWVQVSKSDFINRQILLGKGKQVL